MIQFRPWCVSSFHPLSLESEISVYDSWHEDHELLFIVYLYFKSRITLMWIAYQWLALMFRSKFPTIFPYMEKDKGFLRECSLFMAEGVGIMVLFRKNILPPSQNVKKTFRLSIFLKNYFGPLNFIEKPFCPGSKNWRKKNHPS